MQQPGTAGPGNMLGSCLISFHFLWAILSTSTVYFLCRGKFLQLRKGDKFLLKRSVVTTRLAFCLIGAVKSSKQLQQRALRIREGRKLLMNIDYRRCRRCCAKSDGSPAGASFYTNFHVLLQSLVLGLGQFLLLGIKHLLYFAIFGSGIVKKKLIFYNKESIPNRFRSPIWNRPITSWLRKRLKL